MPILCNYYVTLRCNARCVYCDIGTSEELRRSSLAKVEDVKRNLADIQKLGVRIVDFTGGEPFMHPDLHIFLQEAKRLGMWTTVTTNAMLYPKRAHQLKGLIDLLHFSMDSVDKDVNDISRGIECYDLLIKSIEIAKELKEKPDIEFTVTNETWVHLEKMYEFTSRLGLILIANPVFSYFKEQELQTTVLDYLEEFRKRPLVYLNPGFIKLRREGGNQISEPRCRAMSATIVISPDNEIMMPCYHHTQAKIPIGTDLIGLWKNDIKVNYYRENAGRFSFCQGCTINCYMEPSFAYGLDSYFWMTLPSKVKYAYEKFIIQ
jgi:MoaA/NifB/PqqE/SkfB family radical SAM enzyme